MYLASFIYRTFVFYGLLVSAIGTYSKLLYVVLVLEMKSASTAGRVASIDADSAASADSC